MSNKNSIDKESVLERAVERATKFIVKNGIIILASLVLVSGVVIAITIYNSSTTRSDQKYLVELEGVLSSYRAIYYGEQTPDSTAMIVQATDKLQNIVKNAKTKKLKLRASFTLAGIYFDMENYSEAVKYYKEVSETRGFYLDDVSMYNMSVAQMQLGLYDDAIKTLDNMIKAYPKSYLVPQANIALSEIYIVKNDRAKAISTLKNWLTQNAEKKDNPYLEIVTETLALIESGVY